MNTGTKIFLAVFALFVGVLVLYYGVMTPGEIASPELAIIDPVQDTAEPSDAEFEANRPGTSDASWLPGSEPQHVLPQRVGTEDAAHDSTQRAAQIQMGASELPLALEPTRMLPLANIGSTVLPPIAPESPNPEVKADVPSLVPETSRSQPDPPSRQDTTPKAPPIRTVTERHAGSVKPNVGASITPSDSVTRKLPTPLQTTEYIVKSGDTMMTIAKSWFGDETKWSLIAKANPWIDPARMQIGQKLQLPAKDAKAPPVREQVAPDKSVYVVRSGDSLAKIAREFYGDIALWERIYEANRSVIGDDPAALQVGMKLTLPSKAKSS